ncbi:MAG: hypothetical protein MR303_01955 [Emergencia sp.]|nr:hypothetical protein [Emergencia sp.]
MDKIKAYDDRAMRKSTKFAAIVFGTGLIVFSFYSTVKYSAIIGVVLLLAVIFQKETYVSREGVVLAYDFIVRKHKIVWSFEEITDIHIEYVADPGYVVLHFLRDVMSRRLVFRKQELEQVLELAKSVKPDIHIENVK